MKATVRQSNDSPTNRCLVKLPRYYSSTAASTNVEKCNKYQERNTARITTSSFSNASSVRKCQQPVWQVLFTCTLCPLSHVSRPKQTSWALCPRRQFERLPKKLQVLWTELNKHFFVQTNAIYSPWNENCKFDNGFDISYNLYTLFSGPRWNKDELFS